MRRPHARAGEAGSDAGSASRTRRRRNYSCFLLLAAAVAVAALWNSLQPRHRAVIRWKSLQRLGHRLKHAVGGSARGKHGARRYPVGNHRRGTRHGAAASKPHIRPLPEGIDPPGGSRPCPVDYPRLTKEQISSGERLPYLFGGKPPGCKQCRSDDPWTNFCRVRSSPRMRQPMRGRGLLCGRL